MNVRMHYNVRLSRMARASFYLRGAMRPASLRGLKIAYSNAFNLSISAIMRKIVRARETIVLAGALDQAT